MLAQKMLQSSLSDSKTLRNYNTLQHDLAKIIIDRARVVTVSDWEYVSKFCSRVSRAGITRVMGKLGNEIETLIPMWADRTKALPLRSFCHLLLVRGDDPEGISFSTVRKIMESAEI